MPAPPSVKAEISTDAVHVKIGKCEVDEPALKANLTPKLGAFQFAKTSDTAAAADQPEKIGVNGTNPIARGHSNGFFVQPQKQSFTGLVQKLESETKLGTAVQSLCAVELYVMCLQLDYRTKRDVYFRSEKERDDAILAVVKA